MFRIWASITGQTFPTLIPSMFPFPFIVLGVVVSDFNFSLFRFRLFFLFSICPPADGVKK